MIPKRWVVERSFTWLEKCTQVSVKLHGRNALLVLGYQVDGLKPHSERQFRGIEDGAGGDRSLPMAAVALLELPVGQLALAMTTVGAMEAIWPPPGEECIETLLLGAVLFEEFVQTDAFLELYVVASHGGFPCRSTRYCIYI
jgi:hypothetical protein